MNITVNLTDAEVATLRKWKPEDVSATKVAHNPLLRLTAKLASLLPVEPEIDEGTMYMYGSRDAKYRIVAIFDDGTAAIERVGGNSRGGPGTRLIEKTAKILTDLTEGRATIVTEDRL